MEWIWLDRTGSDLNGSDRTGLDLLWLDWTGSDQIWSERNWPNMTRPDLTVSDSIELDLISSLWSCFFFYCSCEKAEAESTVSLLLWFYVGSDSPLILLRLQAEILLSFSPSDDAASVFVMVTGVYGDVHIHDGGENPFTCLIQFYLHLDADALVFRWTKT